MQSNFILHFINHAAAWSYRRIKEGELENGRDGDKNGCFKKGIAKRARAGECRDDVGRAIGPDRFVSGNNYWQSHAVLETQESIDRTRSSPRSSSAVLLSSLHVLVFSWPSFRDFSVAKNTLIYAYIRPISRFVRAKLEFDEIT